MLVGLISDSHDHLPHIRMAVDIFKHREVKLVLHAGDFCSPFTIPPFEGLNLKGVFGNNDGDYYMLLRQFNKIGAEHLGTFGELEIDGCKVALYHGTDAPITAALEKGDDYDIVVSGHTHQKKVKQENGTLSINPGSAHGFNETATVALLDTESREVKMVELE